MQSLFWYPVVTIQSGLLYHHAKGYGAIKYWYCGKYILLPYIYILLRDHKTFTRFTWEGMAILIYKDRVFCNQKLEISQVVDINIEVNVHLTIYYKTSETAVSIPNLWKL